MIDQTSHLPLYIQVKEYILKRIASKQYPEGSQLPTEKELMEKLRVGRATVRSALAELEHEGRIYKKRGVGTFVAREPVNFGLEPLISLTYSLDKMGIKSENRFLKKDEIVVRDGILLEGWTAGTRVCHMERLRYAEGFPIAVENSYFLPELFEKIRDADSNASIAHLLLSQEAVQVERLEQRIVLRTPDRGERDVLPVTADDRVIELTRWLYGAGGNVPVNFVKFVIPDSILQYPFSVFDQRAGRG